MDNYINKNKGILTNTTVTSKFTYFNKYLKKNAKEILTMLTLYKKIRRN